MKKIYLIAIIFLSVNNIYAQNKFNFRGYEWGTHYTFINTKEKPFSIDTRERYDPINTEDRDNIHQNILTEHTEVAGYEAKAVYIFFNDYYNRRLFKTYYKLYSRGSLSRSIFESNYSYEYISTVFFDLKNKLISIYKDPKTLNDLTLNKFNRAMQNKESIICSIVWEIEDTIIELHLRYHYYFGNIYSTKDVWDIYIIYKDKIFIKELEEKANREIIRRNESTEGL